MGRCGKLTGRLSPIQTLTGRLSPQATLRGRITVPASTGTEYYRGAYEWTPGEETQTVQINGLTALENIVINPIPQNYGRIDWNGARIKVW